MKNFLILFVLVFISCTSKNEIDSIEMLSYFNTPNKFTNYVYVPKKGNVYVIFRNEKNHFDGGLMEIKTNLIQTIEKALDTIDIDALKYQKKKNYWHEGYLNAVKINFKNGEKRYTFYLNSDKPNSAFEPFIELNQQVITDSSKLIRNNWNQYGYFKLKQEEFSAYQFRLDSIRYLQYSKK